jgi:hypothetical protein
VTIDCTRLDAFDATSRDAARRAFAGAAPLPMQQAWRATPEPAFAPAVVRVRWRDDALWVFAELHDADIFSDATDHNQRFWELGDSFEMFLQPVGQAAYVEFQVTPANLQLQLRFPDVGWRSRVSPEDAFSQALMSPGRFQSRIWVDTAAEQWTVLATIPAVSVSGRATLAVGEEWRFSFSRYDYTRSVVAPVISSTSAHAQPGFHRLEEWGQLVVV